MSHRGSISQTPPHDIELENKVKKSTAKLSENLHIVANEPSLAFYRLQEHSRKSLPGLVEKKLEYKQMQQNLQGRCYDAEYAIGAVNTIHRSKPHLSNIMDLLKNSMFLKQQLKYEENRRAEKRPSSMYHNHRTSASFDIPSIIPITLNSITSAAGRFASSPITVSHVQRQMMRASSVNAPNLAAPNITHTRSIPHLADISRRNLGADKESEILRSASLRENRHSTHGVP